MATTGAAGSISGFVFGAAYGAGHHATVAFRHQGQPRYGRLKGELNEGEIYARAP